MKPGQRDDGWHTDGGCSLLHASVTLFGTRNVQVAIEGQEELVTFAQEPGSFYVGALCALEHNVNHQEECLHTFRTKAATASAAATSSGSLADWQADDAAAATADSGLQIAVMIRSDVFGKPGRAISTLHQAQ